MLTGLATLSYPALFTAKQNPAGTLKFSCTLLFDKTDTETIMELSEAVDAAVLEGIETKWNNKTPKFRYQPLRDGDKELEANDPVFKRKVFLYCSTHAAPTVISSDPMVRINQETVYAGCIVKADITPVPYTGIGFSGIEWKLNKIILIKNGPRLNKRQNPEPQTKEVTKA